MHFGDFRGKNEAFQGTDFLYFLLLNFNMQKFQNMEHSNSRAFQGLLKEPTLFSKTFKGLEFFFKIQGLSRTSQGPYEPCTMHLIVTDCIDIWNICIQWLTR